METKKDSLLYYKKLLKRISLDDIDIIVKGEEPKSNFFILAKDIPEIMKAIREGDESVIIPLIANKIQTNKDS